MKKRIFNQNAPGMSLVGAIVAVGFFAAVACLSCKAGAEYFRFRTYTEAVIRANSEVFDLHSKLRQVLLHVSFSQGDSIDLRVKGKPISQHLLVKFGTYAPGSKVGLGEVLVETTCLSLPPTLSKAYHKLNSLPEDLTICRQSGLTCPSDSRLVIRFTKNIDGNSHIENLPEIDGDHSLDQNEGQPLASAFCAKVLSDGAVLLMEFAMAFSDRNNQIMWKKESLSSTMGSGPISISFLDGVYRKSNEIQNAE